MFDDFLCVIPARAGSKGIKDKNIQLVGKDLLFVHSIVHAKEAGIPHDQIVVSSDSITMLNIAKRHSVVAHRRPDNICGDEASTESAMLNVLDRYPDIKHILLLQPTSPIRFNGRVKDCIMQYKSGEYDSLVTVTKFDNLFWHEIRDEAIIDKWSWVCTTECLERPRRQDIQKSRNHKYFENGNIYITKADILKSRCNRIGYKTYVYRISEIEGMQIDTPEELEIFRKLFKGTAQDIINAGI